MYIYIYIYIYCKYQTCLVSAAIYHHRSLDYFRSPCNIQPDLGEVILSTFPILDTLQKKKDG